MCDRIAYVGTTPQEHVLFDVSSSEWLDMSNPEELLLFDCGDVFVQVNVMYCVLYDNK
jgi:hypothetical protein